MSTGEVLSVAASLVAVLMICSLPGLASLRAGGPRDRRVVRRQLAFGWAAAGFVAAWMVLGWYALQAGPRWMTPYRTASAVMMVLYAPLLFVGIRHGNRAAAAAQAADGSAFSGTSVPER